ncbi:hypothetical protein [Alkalicoccus luteus]|uniref:Uncharacterized protein n=1 Tax=Alkalicoccus luteus TaxID=1237094 RepID=A0A969PR61_9BACI|nr:hypothetical protein [Alkalicoccus luteus]NJP38040.1 hypothetical protein [Alkalicoccus luteus]
MSYASALFCHHADPETYFQSTVARMKRKAAGCHYVFDAGTSFLHNRFYVYASSLRGAEFRITLSQDQSKALQKKGPGSLEHFLWSELEKQGFPASKVQ